MGKIIENMTNVSEKETPTAPPPNEVASPTAAPVPTAPPVALKGYYTCPPRNQQPKGYPVQQIPLQGIPAIQNQPYPAASPQHYPQQYPQQYHPTQPGQIAIYPTSQSTPLIVDASGVVDYLKDQMTSSDNVQLFQQMQQNQQQGRRKQREQKSDWDDCCKC